MLCFRRLHPRLRLLLPPFAVFVAKTPENARSAVKLDGFCHENGRKRDKDRYTFFTPGLGGLMARKNGVCVMLVVA